MYIEDENIQPSGWPFFCSYMHFAIRFYFYIGCFDLMMNTSFRLTRLNIEEQHHRCVCTLFMFGVSINQSIPFAYMRSGCWTLMDFFLKFYFIAILYVRFFPLYFQTVVCSICHKRGLFFFLATVTDSGYFDTLHIRLKCIKVDGKSYMNYMLNWVYDRSSTDRGGNILCYSDIRYLYLIKRTVERFWIEFWMCERAGEKWWSFYTCWNIYFYEFVKIDSFFFLRQRLSDVCLG